MKTKILAKFIPLYEGRLGMILRKLSSRTRWYVEAPWFQFAQNISSNAAPSSASAAHVVGTIDREALLFCSTYLFPSIDITLSTAELDHRSCYDYVRRYTLLVCRSKLHMHTPMEQIEPTYVAKTGKWRLTFIKKPKQKAHMVDIA